MQENNIEIYSTHDERKSVAAENVMITLNTKTYKYMTSVSKNFYIDKLNGILNKYNNTYHSTTKIRPIGVKSSKYIDFLQETIFQISFKSSCDTVLSIYVISDLKSQNIFGKFYK